MRISLINNNLRSPISYKKNTNYKNNVQITFKQNNPLKPEYKILIAKRKSVLESIKLLEYELERAKNYNAKQAEIDTLDKIEKEKKSKNFNLLGALLTGELKNIESKHWIEYYTERNVVDYLRCNGQKILTIKKQLEEYLTLIDEQLSLYEKKPNGEFEQTTTFVPLAVIPNIQKTQSPSPTLEEYKRLRKEFNEKLRKLDISDPTRKAAAKKLKEMERQMIEQNISFVSKAPENFASEKERWDYFYKGIDANVRNEASAMDILDQFSRLGGRMYDKNTGRRSIADIGTAVLIYANEKATSIESSNRILQKYVDSVFKFATNEIPPRGYSPDAAELLPAYNNSIKVMTKDTVIKFINAFKNIAVDKQQYIDIKYFLQDGIWQSFYPQLKPQDLPDIQKALDEFAKAVENLPYDIMKIN